MKLISSKYGRIYRIISLLLALHFLNLSIDSKDPHPDNIPEDLSFNDIETITEFVAEIVFGWHDAFEEHEEHDYNDGGSLEFYKLYCTNNSFTSIQKNLQASLPIKFLIRNSDEVSSLCKEVNSPPPKS